jgi:hypothetical protein
MSMSPGLLCGQRGLLLGAMNFLPSDKSHASACARAAALARVLSFAAIVGLSCEALALPTINVDFNSTDGTAGTYSGIGAAPDPGTIWNGLPVGAEAGAPLVAAFASGALVTSTGAVSPVTVTLGNFRVYEADERPASTAPALMTDFAYQQNLGPGGPDATFSIDHLTPLTTCISTRRTEVTRTQRRSLRSTPFPRQRLIRG